MTSSAAPAPLRSAALSAGTTQRTQADALVHAEV